MQPFPAAAPEGAHHAPRPSRANLKAPAPAATGAAVGNEASSEAESSGGARTGAGTAGMPDASGPARPGEFREPPPPRDERIILHVDIDAFFAAIEQQLDPRLKGRPVIVGAGVIASCSYEARRFGLRAGMTLSEARRRCPDALILEGHAQVYRCFAEQIFACCRVFSPAVETYLDEAYCDLSGTARLHGDPLDQRVRRGRPRFVARRRR